MWKLYPASYKKNMLRNLPRIVMISYLGSIVGQQQLNIDQINIVYRASHFVLFKIGNSLNVNTVSCLLYEKYVT